jgi:DNA-binding HxlR family transcriptional regulator
LCLAVTSTKLGIVTTTSSPASERFEISAPHRELLDQVLDKWSLLILNELCERPMRFSELRRVIPAVTQKSLTATLKRLERNGIIERAVLSTRPVAVEYSITHLGKTLRPPVEAILDWAGEQMPLIEQARDRYDSALDSPGSEESLRRL